MHKRNRLLSSSCLLGVLLTTACEAPSTPSPSAAPASEAPAAPAQAPASPPAASPPASDAPETPAAGNLGSSSSGLTASNCRQLTSAKATASGDDGAGSVAANTQDDKLDTRWSGPGKGSWLKLDLGGSQTLAGATIAWHQGAQRQNHFTLETSEDGTTYTQAYAATSALTADAQTYRFTSTRKARYLRVTVNGNTVNDWASITEARACGDDTTTPPTAPTTDSGPALPRQPYLQSVGTTSALVVFRTGVSCTPFVRYGEGSDISRTATATAAGWQHAVKLTGLLPGKTYSYVVEACGSVTGVRRFQTASGPETTRVHFTAMGDFGTGGSLQTKVLQQLTVARAGEFLLTLGDNAYSSGTDAEFQSNMFKPMAALLREVPLFPTPGNHEYVTSNAKPYLDNFYLPANNSAKSERYYSFDWGPVHFASLDSNCRNFTIADCTTALQKTWLAQDLAATSRPWKIVFFHHPPWSSGEHLSTTAMRREFAPLFEQYGVDLVLTGHDHNYERTRPMKGDAVAPSGTRGIPYLVVGSGGATLRPFPGAQPSWTAFRDNTNVGYLDVVVDGGTLTTKFITSSGTVRDSLTLTKTLPAAVASPSGVSAMSVDAPQGPTYDPKHQPEFLRDQKPVPPADTLESVADEPEPVPATALEQQ
ncbi:metallophosphoesterase [Archangium violaceum]|uniref:Serine/threonine protein phosphatase n=1 Tax=Archangium violaceum Cb vi76 TaxID=1406225 RepID=A0A084SMP2_9BACT|nr:metallophosphoesterase [Archangium violaceum]KFA89727.1 serine/threonine protein phosphatase [Archangium violaceum Cb vi76]